MRRPVCFVTLLFTAAIWVAVLISPAKERIDEKADGRTVTVTGTVEWKEYARTSSDDQSMRVTLKDIRIETGIPAEMGFDVYSDDKILCVLSDDPELQANWAQEEAEIRVRGKLRLYDRPTNDGEFDAFLYYTQVQGYLFSLRDAHILAFTNTKSPLKSHMYAVRQDLSDALDRIYGNVSTDQSAGDNRPASAAVTSTSDNGTASIMKAMLLGQTSLLDPELKDRFQSAGIIHVLCISGVHLSLIGSGIYVLLRKAGVPITLSCTVSVILLFLYGLMTGMHTSCVRALIMFSFQTAAKALGRTYDTMTALSVAAVLLLIEQPAYLYHSGFLFSFAAVIAITLVSEAFPRKAAPLLIPVCTLPVQLSFYYTFPLYSVLLNLVVIALAPFLIAGGILSLIPYIPVLLLSGVAHAAGIDTAATTVSSISVKAPYLSTLLFNVSRLIAKIPNGILRLFDRLCTATESLPFHTLTPGKPAFGLVLAYYLLVAASTAYGLYSNYRSNSKIIKTTAIQTALMTSAVAMILGIRFKSPFSLYMWDVGQGDGLCLMTHDECGDSCILIDGGSSSRQGIAKYVEIPFLKCHGISRIDCCVVTHDDLDHCSGVTELLEQHGEADGIEIGSVALPSVTDECKGKLYIQIEETARKKGIPVLHLSRGMTFSIGALNIECIHPGQNADYEDSNAYSVVLLLTYGDFSAVLTGDLEGEGERDLLACLKQQRINADILKVAHHGSAGGTSQEFLQKVSAQTALISSGKDNPYGHPSPETVTRLLKAGMRVYNTRETGQISILTDGRSNYSVETFCTVP